MPWSLEALARSAGDALPPGYDRYIVADAKQDGRRPLLSVGIPALGSIEFSSKHDGE